MGLPGCDKFQLSCHLPFSIPAQAGIQGRGGDGLSFTTDIGALFRGSPRVSASGQADGCEFTVSKDGNADVDCEGVPGVVAGELSSNLEQEHRELRGSLDKLKIYPVISLGLSYRF